MEKKNYCGWFEKKISKNTGKEYGSGSFSPKDIDALVELAKKSPKGYVNFFWSIYQDKPSITLCEPKDKVDTVAYYEQNRPTASDIPW